MTSEEEGPVSFFMQRKPLRVWNPGAVFGLFLFHGHVFRLAYVACFVLGCDG